MAKIKYKNTEIVAYDGPERIFKEPKRMLCWDACYNGPVEAYVVAFLPKNSEDRARVLALQCSGQGSGYRFFQFCADFPERRMTNKEVQWWLAKGYGIICIDGTTYTEMCFDERKLNDMCYHLIKKFEDTEYHAPTLEYIGVEHLMPEAVKAKR